jgi:hypothetical protein
MSGRRALQWPEEEMGEGSGSARTLPFKQRGIQLSISHGNENVNVDPQRHRLEIKELIPKSR